MTTKRTGKEKERIDIKMPITALEIIALVNDFLRYYGLDPWERAVTTYREKYGKDADTPRELVDFIEVLAAFLPDDWHKELAERFVFIYRQKYGDYEYSDNDE
ncbi:MAG: hypothetical protein RXN93_06675 [Thermocladium sp.]